MKIFSKAQVYNRKTGKPDKFEYVHNETYVCDYCGKEIADCIIYTWITPRESGDIEEIWSELDDIDGFPHDALWPLYNNNGDFHFCDDEGESECQYKLMSEFLAGENKYYGICRMLYEARRVVLAKLVKEYSIGELIGEDYDESEQL